MRFSFPQSLPHGLRAILISTTILYLLELIPGFGSFLIRWGSLIPERIFGNGEAWRIVTYLFLHDSYNPMHLVFNMLALWMFGMELEQQWGTRKFVLFYFISGIGSGLFSFFYWQTPIIGASGSIMALLTAYAFCFPKQTILMFFVFPMPVWAAVAIIGFISLIGSFSSAGGIAHITHLGGILVAIVYSKTIPFFTHIKDSASSKLVEIKQKAEDAQTREKQEYYDRMIDPILKKISDQGMDSLTPKEKELLEEASRKYRGIFNQSKIVPFRKK